MQISKKAKLFVFFSAIVIFIVLLLINGVSLEMDGVISLNSKYHDSSHEAVLADYDFDDEHISKIEEICTVDVDEYNSIYLAEVDDGLLVCQMKNKNDRYYYMGNYLLYHSESETDYSNDSGLNVNSFSRLKSTAFYSGNIEIAVIIDEYEDEISADYSKVDTGFCLDDENVILVYRIIT